MKNIDRPYSVSQLALKYSQYYYSALNGKGHGIHSPFIFDFTRNVLNNGRRFPNQPDIEHARKELLRDRTSLEVRDLGAGGLTEPVKRKRVSDLAATALKGRRYAEVLYRLAAHYAPRTIIELGTSLGITTAYLARGAQKGNVVTVEGSAAIANVAARTWQKLNLPNIRPIVSAFDEVLPSLVREFKHPCVLYIDGNHLKEATTEYFETIIPYCNEETILVFDDIHWSGGMEEAWEWIKRHPSVRYSVDIFFLGFIFFRKEFRVKQHFVIRY